MSAALIPVKDLSGSKTRMAPELGRNELDALCLAMLGDLIEALESARRVERVAVVTPDERVAEAAEAAGATAFVQADPGLNASLESGARAFELSDDDPLLVVLGDVAAARSEDIDRLFEIADGMGAPSVVVAEADDGGTTALLRTPYAAIAPHFGAGSAHRHRQAAERAGVACRSVRLASLSLDLDDADDVNRLLSSDADDPAGALGPASRTRAVLSGLAGEHP